MPRIELLSGIKMDTHDEAEQADVYVDSCCLNCDTPALRKFGGLSGHSHDIHPCPWCDTVLVDINNNKGYNYGTSSLFLYPDLTDHQTGAAWTTKSDYPMLRHAFNAKDSTPAREKHILDSYGIRWTSLNFIPGRLPITNCVLDFMHNVFLGIICHLFMTVLFAGYMFTGIGGLDSPKQRFEDLVNAVRWPSHCTRLPKNVLTPSASCSHCS